jgi:hypothetical protein
VKLLKFDDFRNTGAILHELATTSYGRAFMARRRFWADELRHGELLLVGRVV